MFFGNLGVCEQKYRADIFQSSFGAQHCQISLKKERKKERMRDGEMDGWRDGWMEGGMEGGMDGGIDVWIDGRQ